MALLDPSRLYSTLLNTGLHNKDNALHQVIHDLIDTIIAINKQVNGLASSSSSATTTVNNTIQQLLDSSSFDFSTPDDFQIPGPIGPAGPMVPYHIGINEVFLVPLYKQALFAMNIDNEGIIEVDGFLIEVDGSDIDTSVTQQFNLGDDISIEDNIIRNISSVDLSDSSTGPWTPTDVSGAGLALIINNASYTKIGGMVLLAGFIQYPITASGANALIGGIPYNGGSSVGLAAALTGAGITIMGVIYGTDNKITLQNEATGAQITNVQLSNQSLLFTIPYPTV